MPVAFLEHVFLILDERDAETCQQRVAEMHSTDDVERDVRDERSELENLFYKDFDHITASHR